MHKNSVKIFCAVFVIAVSAGYFFWFKPKFSQANSMPPDMATEVTVIEVKKENVQLFLELPARVEAQKISEIRPQISGVIKKIKFTEGSLVKKGQQLYQIDEAIYREAWNSANRNFKSLKAKKQRYQNLLEQDAISKQEFDDIEAAYAQARSQAQAAKTNLDYTKVLAPISGYIGKSNITEGALVTTNQTEVLTTITQLDPVYVDMAQASKDAAKFGNQNGITVTLITEDPDYKNSGKLKFSEKFADTDTDSVRLRAVFSNKDKKLIPGMFVTGKLHLKTFQAVTVPQRAASRGPDGNLIVWVIDQNNIAKPRAIKSEQISNDSWVITEGLKEGETIIYEGEQKIFDGAKVKPVPLEENQKIAESKS